MCVVLVKMGLGYKLRIHYFSEDGSLKYINCLIFEFSSYLFQYVHNLVNWFFWGDEVFVEVKCLDWSVFMSVGYATCYWCHVMEKEFFEDEEIVAYMSNNFICIKVDREECSDVDNIYMSAVNMLYGRGGWFMTIVMIIDCEFFFGGTYFLL